MEGEDKCKGSFNDRVDKIFGSLSSSSSTPWSLTDAQVQKRVWNRHRDVESEYRNDDETPTSSSFDNLFKKRRKGLEDLGDEGEDDGQIDQDHNERDEWDIRSSIGLDCTLDNEEEEDAYDKMAEGRDDAGDRLYMKDITDHGPYLNSHNVLPTLVHDAPKDPRANHDAAKTRLKEDEDDAVGEKSGSSQASDEPMFDVEGPCATVTESEDGRRIKSILKRKSEAVVKPAKRVRFDPMCQNHLVEEHEEVLQKREDTLTGQSLMQLSGGGDASILSEDGRSVPDYVLNPSNYTRYSFDSSDDVNDKSNSQAYLDFVEHVKKPHHVELEQKLEDDSSADLPKPVLFIPRKKANDARPVNGNEEKLEQSSTRAGSGVGIAAEEVSSEMQEDESTVDAVRPKARYQRVHRQYRTRLEAEDNVC